MATTIDATDVGLVVDGEVVRGDGGTYPVLNPARPAEVVFDAPTASVEQVDRAVESARHAQSRWAALPRAERAALIFRATQSAAALVDSAGLAALLTREHGKVLWESQFDAGTIGGMGAAFSPLVDEALAERTWIDGQRVNRVVRRTPRGGGHHPPLQLAPVSAGQQGVAGAAGREHRGGQDATHMSRRGPGPDGRYGRASCRRGCSMRSTGRGRSWAGPWSTTPVWGWFR